jgi:hypothetical protein
MYIATEEHRKALSDALRGKPKSKEHNHTVSLALKGKPFTDDRKKAISKSLTGKRYKPRNESHNRAIAKAIRLRYKTCTPRVDQGSAEYFEKLNRQGFHIQYPNVYLSELGYWADGYDPVIHAWFEYDTPCHLNPRRKTKDLKRQTEIIEHFKSTGKPLTAFYRINATGVGKFELVNII